MKYSIIEDIYLGNRGQCDAISKSSRNNKLSCECLKLYDGLMKTLSEEQKELLENLLNKEIETEAETALIHFKEGLKIGLLLFSECLQD